MNANSNPNKSALEWWRALTDEEQKKVAQRSKPDWTFDMFTRSTFAIRQAHSVVLQKGSL